MGGQHQSQAWKQEVEGRSVCWLPVRNTQVSESSGTGPTYRTLYTPQAAPYTWHGTVDRSTPPETDVDWCHCPGAWETQQQSHLRKAVGGASAYGL